MSDLNLRILITASDLASNVIRGLTSSLGGGGMGSAVGVVGAIAAVGVAAAAMAVGVGVTAVKAAGDFQQQMTKLYTTAGESKSNLQMVGDGILTMSSQVGTSASTLGDAMYWIESGGLHGAAGLTALKVAAEAASAEGANLDQVSIALAASLAAYAGKGMSAVQVMNTLTAATGQGMMTFEQLSGSLASVLPASAKFGISLNNVTAAMATMTAQGDPAANAATHLRQMILALEAPSKIGAAALASVGLSSQQVATEMKTSLPTALQMITDAVGKKFPEGSAAYNDAIKNIAGGSKQMMGFLELTGSHMQTFAANVGKISGAVKAGGNDLMGWSDIQNNFNFKIAQFQALAGTLMIRLGQQLLPTLTKLATAIMPIVTLFVTWIGQSNILQGSLGFLTNGIDSMATMISGSFTNMQQNAAYSMLTMRDDSISKSLETAKGVVANIEYQRHYLEMSLSQTTDSTQKASLKQQLIVNTTSLKQAQLVVNNYTTQKKGIETQMNNTTDSVKLAALQQKDVAVSTSLDQANGVVANYQQQQHDVVMQLQRTTDPVRKAYLETKLVAIDASLKQAEGVVANYTDQKNRVTAQMDDMKAKVNADNNNILTNTLATFAKFGAALKPMTDAFQHARVLLGQIAGDINAAIASPQFRQGIMLLAGAVIWCANTFGRLVYWLMLAGKWLLDNKAGMLLLEGVALALAFVIGVVLVAGFVLLIVQMSTFLLLCLVIFGPIIAIILLIQNWGAVMQWLGGVWNNVIAGIENAWNGLVAWIWGAGVALMNNLIDGIKSKIPDLNGVMSNVMGQIEAWLPHSPAKVGPLMHLNEYGPAFVRGIATGIDRSLPLLQTSLALMVTPMHQVASTGGVASGYTPTGIASPSGSSSTSGQVVNVYVTISNINDFGPNMPTTVANQLANTVSQVLARNMRTQSGRIVIGQG